MSGKNSGRFWRYALGEILLVVIGILIALQINNWNEERKEHRQIRELALNLSAAIARDMEMIGPVEVQITGNIIQAEKYADYARGRAMEQFSNAEVYFLTSLVGYRSYAWDRAAMEQLKASGGLRQMRNQELVERISSYDALTRHLDEDHAWDHQLVAKAGERIDMLRDRNFEPGGMEIWDWQDGITAVEIEQRLTDFRSTAEFARLHQQNLPLLTDDVRELQRLANQMLQMAGSMKPRPETELPRLRRMAAEIRSMIAEEYLEQ